MQRASSVPRQRRMTMSMEVDVFKAVAGSCLQALFCRASGRMPSMHGIPHLPKTLM